MVFQHISWIPSYSEAYVSKLMYSLPGAHDRALLSPLLNIIRTSKARYFRSASSGCLQYHAAGLSNYMSFLF